jgi:hypothetical protein
MANENPDIVAAFIADIEGKIAALQAILLSLKSASALGALGAAVEGIDLPSGVSVAPPELGQPIDLPDGAFFGKSVPACIKLYLSAVRKKKTGKEIATALREGGVESTAGSFEGIVNTALIRLRTAGEVLKFKDGWGLSEWYPANMRTSGAMGKSPAKSKKKGKKAKVKAASQTATSNPKPEAKKVTEMRKPEDKPETRILAYFKANPREVAASEVASSLGLKIQTAHLILAKLAHQKKIEKLSPGHFKTLAAVG